MGFEPSALFQCMVFGLIEAGTGGEDAVIDASGRGETIRIRVRKASGDVAMSVIGEGYDEVGAQLVLACLQKISINHLRELHLEPLRTPTPVLQRVK